MSRKSPTSDTGVQTNQNQRDRDNQVGANKDKPHQRNQRNNQQQQQQRERRDSGRNDGQENKGGYRVSSLCIDRCCLLIHFSFIEPEPTSE